MNPSQIDALIDTWLTDTELESSLSRIMAHRNFDTLRELGHPVVVNVLTRLAKGSIAPNYFPLLYRITGVNPVPPEFSGRVQSMTNSWVLWGKEQGYFE